MYTYTYIHTHTYTHISIHTFPQKEVLPQFGFFWDSEIDNAVSYSTNPRKSRVVL